MNFGCGHPDAEATDDGVLDGVLAGVFVGVELEPQPQSPTPNINPSKTPKILRDGNLCMCFPPVGKWKKYCSTSV